MKHYDVLHDTWLRGRPYASGSTAILGDEDAAGYMRAGLIAGRDVVEVEPETVAAETVVAEAVEVKAVEPKAEPKATKKK